MTDAPRDVPALKPCPFCGGDARINSFKPGGDVWVTFGYCIACQATGPEYVTHDGTASVSTAVAAWNRRAASETKGGGDG